VSAPRGVKFEQPSIFGLIDGGLEVVSVEYDDVFLRGSSILIFLCVCSENE
jgi:hypothetical protein